MTVSTPANGASFGEGDAIGFSGTAGDTEDGDVTAGLIWVSDRAGQIGSGGLFTRTDLAVGVHTITAMVTDTGGLTGTAAITLSVKANNPPTVTVSAPADGAAFSIVQTISFSGTAGDSEDGDLTAGLTWISNREGHIGTGGYFTSAVLSVGVHTITALVTDTGGLTTTAEITLSVKADSPPVITVITPAGGTSFMLGQAISFRAIAGDSQDNDLTADLIWMSDRVGQIGSGGLFTRTDLAVGLHTITVQVSASTGLTGVREFRLTVVGSKTYLPIIMKQ